MIRRVLTVIAAAVLVILVVYAALLYLNTAAHARAGGGVSSGSRGSYSASPPRAYSPSTSYSASKPLPPAAVPLRPTPPPAWSPSERVRSSAPTPSYAPAPSYAPSQGGGGFSMMDYLILNQLLNNNHNQPKAPTALPPVPYAGAAGPKVNEDVSIPPPANSGNWDMIFAIFLGVIALAVFVLVAGVILTRAKKIHQGI